MHTILQRDTFKLYPLAYDIGSIELRNSNELVHVKYCRNWERLFDRITTQ
jgi:hypothetical protein